MTKSSARVYEENIRDLVHKPGEMRERVRSIVVPEQLGEALAWIAEGRDMDLDLRMESVHDGILVSAVVDAQMDAECGRCLRHFSEPFQVEFQELFAYTPTEADEHEVHGDHVNLEPPLRDAVVLALPFQPVCRPDCPGLDPESGELRDAHEEHTPGAEIDPRWAALAGFAPEVPEEDVNRDSDSARK